MTLLLTRSLPDGNAVRGMLYYPTPDLPPSPSSRGGVPPPEGWRNALNGRSEETIGGVPTLENAAYLIPPGTYTLTVTYSPRFKRPLPLVCNVPGRSAIRFHKGSRPEHSLGCILLPTQDAVSALTSFIRSNEKVLLTIR